MHYVNIKKATCALAVWTPLHARLFCRPFQPPVSFLPLKRSSTKYPQGEASRLFNTLHQSQKTASDIVDWSLQRLVHGSFDSTIMFLFPLSYAFLSQAGCFP